MRRASSNSQGRRADTVRRARFHNLYPPMHMHERGEQGVAHPCSDILGACRFILICDDGAIRH